MSGSGTWPLILNLGNSIIGVAVLAMPFCFKQCGIILGIVLLLFCTWLTLVSCQLLMKAAVVSRRRSYEYLAYFTFGAPGKFVIEIGMIGLQIGTLIAQIVVIGDLGPGIVSKVVGVENTSNLRTVLIVFLCLCVGLPLGLLKDLRSVSRASTLCICFYTIFVFYVMFLSIPNLWTGNWYPKVAFWRPEGLFQTLPIFSLSFGCQTQLFLLYDSLPEPTLKSINSVISSAVNLCAVAYLLVGFFGYIAFYEQDVGGDIITLFPSTFAADMMKLFFVVSIAVTFPLIIFPCRASLYTLLFPQKHKTYEDLQDEGHMPELHFQFITVSIVIGSMIIGILVPNVEFILGMNGATMGTLICYIFPALFFVRVVANKAEGRHIARLVMVLGITILLVSTFATLYSQDKAHTHPVKVEETLAKKDLPLLDKPAELPLAVAVETKDEKRVEPPVPDAPLDTIEQKEIIEKKSKELPKKDGLDEAKVPDKDKEKSSDVEKEKRVVNDEEESKKRDGGEEGAKPGLETKMEGEKKEVVEKEEHLKEREKKIEENEQKQQVLLEKLVEQQEEQKHLINEQKELLKELKEHKEKEHVEKDDEAPAQVLQPIQVVQGVQQPVQGAQQPVQGVQQPVQGVQQLPVQVVQQPVQGVQGVQQPVQGIQQQVQGQLPVQGVQQPVQGVQQPVQGGQLPLQGGQLPVQEVQQQMQGVQQPVQGVQQQVQGIQQNPVQAGQLPVQQQVVQQPVQQPVQGGQLPVQGVQQQVLQQQPIVNQQAQVKVNNVGQQGLHKQLVQNVNQGLNQQQPVNLLNKQQILGQEMVQGQGQKMGQGLKKPLDININFNKNSAKNLGDVKQAPAADGGGPKRLKRELSEVADVLQEVEGLGGHLNKRATHEKNIASINQGSRRR